MASKGVFGSTTSLQGVTAGDTIPREYHRKVLKKIAQLTKVVHSLQTKNDELEETAELLQSQHEAEAQRLTADMAAIQQQLSEEKNKTLQLEDDKRTAIEENAKLTKEREKYCSEVEEKFSAINKENALQFKDLKETLDRTHQELLRQREESSRLSADCTKAQQAIVNLENSHKLAMNEQQKSHAMAVGKLQKELEKVNKEHSGRVAELEHEHKKELHQLKILVNKEQQLEAERKLEQHKALTDDFAKKETALHQQVSTLTQELSLVKDKLALLAQRERELERHLEDSRNNKDELVERLTEREREVSELQGALSTSQVELSVAKDRLAQQRDEIMKLSATIGELEALRLSQQQTRANLQEEIQKLTLEVDHLLRERDKAASLQQTSTEQLNSKVESLEKEVDWLKKDRQQLRAQYALEIEAAHAHLGEKESSLSQQHLAALEQLKKHHQDELKALMSEKQEAMAALRSELHLEHSRELEVLHMRLKEQEIVMSGSISSKTEELSGVQLELSHLRAASREKEKQLQTANGCIKDLQGKLTEKTADLQAVKEKWETSKLEISNMKSVLESQHLEHEQSVKRLREHVDAVRRKEKADAEQVWTQNLREKLSALQSELSQQYSAESRAALNKMADLKETAFNQARDEWCQQKSQLMKQISELKEELQRVSQSSEAAVKLANESAQTQISALRETIDAERIKSSTTLEQLKLTHQSALSELEETMSREQQAMCSTLEQAHQLKLQETHNANQLAVKLLREEMERQRQQDKQQLMICHTAEMDDLKMELQKQHDASLSELEKHHSSALYQCRHDMNQQICKLQDEVSTEQNKVATLQTDLSKRDVSLLRLNEKVATLRAEKGDLQKQIDLQNHEMSIVRQECSTQLRMKEQQLITAHNVEMESLMSQHKHQSHLLLKNFNKAKELLNAKLEEAEKRLSEADLRYKHRESRPEDLDKIQKLMAAVSELERRIKELIAEKRVFHMELVNREKNYNKLFNANPLVGVIDPLCAKKKGGSVPSSPASSRHSSAPTLQLPTTVESLPALSVAAPSVSKSSKTTVLPGGYHQLKQSSLPALVSSSPKVSHTGPQRQPPRVSCLENGGKATNSAHNSKMSQSLDTFAQPEMVVQ